MDEIGNIHKQNYELCFVFLTDPEFTDNELIRAYCKLVKREHFYRYHKLKENYFQLLKWMKLEIYVNKNKHFATSNTMTKIIKHPKYQNK
jgi:hypothetical protein